jgi:hypothetical protein
VTVRGLLQTPVERCAWKVADVCASVFSILQAIRQDEQPAAAEPIA